MAKYGEFKYGTEKYGSQNSAVPAAGPAGLPIGAIAESIGVELPGATSISPYINSSSPRFISPDKFIENIYMGF